MRQYGIVLVLILLFFCPAYAQVPEERVAVLARGINIVHWFRFPARMTADYFRNYIGADELGQLRRYGFTFVRLPVQPEILRSANGPAIRRALRAAIGAIQQAGMAVVVDLHPYRWRLENNAEDRAEFLQTWRSLAPLLADTDPDVTFVEILNEPVFQDDPGSWHRLQAEAAQIIRAALPGHTLIATGHFWGGLRGLLALTPLDDRNVVYSFHFYQPQFWTTLASSIPDSPDNRAHNPDRPAIARLPWPSGDKAACMEAAGTQHARTLALIAANYCGHGWGRDQMRRLIGQAGDWAQRHQVPVIAGEIGVSDRIPAEMRSRWLQDVRTVLESLRIGWALWGYDDVMGLKRTRNAQGEVHMHTEILPGLGLAAD